MERSKNTDFEIQLLNKRREMIIMIPRIYATLDMIRTSSQLRLYGPL